MLVETTSTCAFTLCTYGMAQHRGVVNLSVEAHVHMSPVVSRDHVLLLEG